MDYLATYILAELMGTAAVAELQPECTVPLVGASGAIARVQGAYLIPY